MPAFEQTLRKHVVECHLGDDKYHVACQCGMFTMNLITGCHNQGLQSLVCELLKTKERLPLYNSIKIALYCHSVHEGKHTLTNQHGLLSIHLLNSH